MKKRSIPAFLICILMLLPASPMIETVELASSPASRVQSTEVTPQLLAGLQSSVDVFQDDLGIPHIFAKKANDLFFMQGFIHARDRFFQMDTMRRTAEGTLSEILGPGSLGQDAQLRALGLARAAAKALPLLRPETRRIFKAYARGINAYLAANPLPAEYQRLKITKARPWKEEDSLSIGKLIAFSLSFSLNDMTASTALAAYQAAGKAKNFDGSTLFFEDLFRSAPFDPAYTVPDSQGVPPPAAPQQNEIRADAEAQLKDRLRREREWGEAHAKTVKPETIEMAREYLESFKELPFIGELSKLGEPSIGSNWFLLSGRNTESGFSMVTGDPHLGLSTPPVWYQIQLNLSDRKNPLNVIGVSFAGAPGVVIGHNDNVAWSFTVTGFDVTDVYQEQIEVGLTSISIVSGGKKFPAEIQPQTFLVNQVVADKNDNIVEAPSNIGLPTSTASIPFRNNAAIIGINLANRTALSVQYPGFGATLEIETFLDLARAKTVDDCRQAVQFFDVGSQNAAIATTAGDIGYFSIGEVPLRKDLESGKVVGVPPFLIRNGASGDNDWQPLRKKQFRQSLPTEILPFDEMPQVVNPARGFIVSANADPAGGTADNDPLNLRRKNGAIFYLSAFYANGSRASRLTRDIQAVLASGNKINVATARRIQASVRMRDAEIFTPFLLQAFDNARKSGARPEIAALAADAGIQEAVSRFRTWDFTTSTGLRVGYDAFVPFNQGDPTETQINNSVSTTIYSVWRSQIIRNALDSVSSSLQAPTVDGQLALAALRNILDNFPSRKGIGASGVIFFSVPEMLNSTPEDQRDFVLLQSLRQALDLLAGPDFQLAFNGSKRQRDYRWGILHRIVFSHPLGGDFNIPSTTGNFVSPFPQLPGLPRDGGVEVPNASSHNVRSRTATGFTFGGGPSQRFTAVMNPNGIESVNAIPGGQSGDLNSPMRDNLLRFWLPADVYPYMTDRTKLEQQAQRFLFKPSK